MSYVDTQYELNKLCGLLIDADYICVDTEFLRERTFFPQLCLIQLGVPEFQSSGVKEKNDSETQKLRNFAIDPLAGLDLSPLLKILTGDQLLILHSGKQDLEIIYNLANALPKNVFDTQIAAMVCGFGEQVSYVELVREFCGAAIDKSQRYTDWSKRPLSAKQIEYALADVEYLPVIYKKLSEKINTDERKVWLQEEDNWLTNPDNYRDIPDEAWERIKHRDKKNSHLGVLQEIAKWRDEKARKHDKPRRWVMKDESLIEIALRKPASVDDVKNIRNIGSLSKGMPEEIVAAVKRGLDIPKDKLPRLKKRPQKTADAGVVDLLKLLFKLKCAESGVAPKLMGNSDDIEKLALGEANHFSTGWRYENFGKYAEKLLAGELSFSVDVNTGKLKIE